MSISLFIKKKKIININKEIHKLCAAILSKL